MDRIEINVIWYVREDSTPKTNQFEFELDEALEDDLVHTECLSYEDDEYLLELDGLITNKLTERISMISLRIVDKNNEREECWDNENFLRGLIKLEQESIDSALDESDVKVTHSLLNRIINLLKVGQKKGML
jgi:hypothetical protein